MSHDMSISRRSCVNKVRIPDRRAYDNLFFPNKRLEKLISMYECFIMV